MNSWKILAVFLIGLMIPTIFFLADLNFIGIQKINGTSIEFGFLDLASIALTAATVVLAGVALIIAVISIFGFQYISKSSTEAAKNTAKKEVSRLLTEKFEEEIEIRIVKNLSGLGIMSDKDSTNRELGENFDEDDDGNR